jgi:hypothetical protein
MTTNPIQERINGGMSAIAAVLTEATCGEACWHAREEVCRCSCGGRNHGCLRDGCGDRPERTARIDGLRYRLAAVGDVHAEARRLNEAAGITFHYADSSRDPCFRHAPAKTRPATEAQIGNWPELASYRESDEVKPYLLWLRIDS